jgi:hypothetical protein
VNRDSGLVSPWEHVDFDLAIDEEKALAATPWPLALRRVKRERHKEHLGDVDRTCVKPIIDLRLPGVRQ